MAVSKVSIHPEFVALAAAVGQALDQWSLVEIELAGFFQELSGMPSEQAAQVVMASIQSFETRLNVCNNIASFGNLPPLETSYWNWLFGRLSKKAKKRNELAHFSIVNWEEDEHRPSTWRLVPYFSLGKMVLNYNEGLSLKEVRERGESFSALLHQLGWLVRQIRVRKGKLTKNPLREPDQVQALREKAAQTPTENEHQPQSSKA